MDTEVQFSERGRFPAPGEGPERGPRSAFFLHFADWGLWRRAALLGSVCGFFLMLLNTFVVQPFLIPSGSMENTLRVGDRVLLNKLSYRFGSEPRRGDVIIFDGTGSFVRGSSSENQVTRGLREVASAVGLAKPYGTDYIKRVVGVGGDRVACCDKRGRIKVNGVAVDEDYLYPGDAPSQVAFDILVPERKLWVMGDHRSDSRDSRDHLGGPGGGMVPVDRVIGRADWIVWPTGHRTSLDRPTAFEGVPIPSRHGADGGYG